MISGSGDWDEMCNNVSPVLDNCSKSASMVRSIASRVFVSNCFATLLSAEFVLSIAQIIPPIFCNKEYIPGGFQQNSLMTRSTNGTGLINFRDVKRMEMGRRP